MKRAFLLAIFVLAATSAIPQTKTGSLRDINEVFSNAKRLMATYGVTCDEMVWSGIQARANDSAQRFPTSFYSSDPLNVSGCPYIVQADTTNFFLKTMLLAEEGHITSSKARELEGDFSDLQTAKTLASSAAEDYSLHAERLRSQEKIPPEGKAISDNSNDEPVSIFYWANDLNTICQMESPPAGTEFPARTTDFLDSNVMRKILEHKTNQGTCIGYILGRAEAMSEMNNPEATRSIEKVGKVCFPLHNPSEELVAAVKEKLAKESILHDKQLPASIAVDLALKDLFPCPAK